MPEPMLSLRGLRVQYGGIVALHGIDLDVHEGEVVTLIGANGAGKSTTLRTISGLLRPSAGEVWFGGEPMHRKRPDEIVSLGVIHSPEGRRVFARMSVKENLLMGSYARTGGDIDAVLALFPILAERAKQLAGTLSGGEQQMLAIGRALMARPRVLLLDEPSLGLAPLVVERIYDTLRQINEAGTTILLVEQNATVALELASRGYVLEAGSVVLAGTSAELQASPDVRRAYLGID